jgi:hypothetical protein
VAILLWLVASTIAQSVTVPQATPTLADALTRERIFSPLGMAATRTSLREAWEDPRMARGYWWDEARQTLRPLTLETLRVNISGVAPAGAISSTALDMTLWLRFLLRRGVQGGKALVSPATLTTTWTPQIPIGNTIGYGMGSALPSITMQLVPQYLLGELPPATRANVGLGFTFEESQTGAVSAMTFHRPGALPVMRLTPVASTLPTVAEIMTLRRIAAASALGTMRTTGSVRVPQSAVEGRFSLSTAGDDRLRLDLDLDGSVQIRTVPNKDRASQSVSGASSREPTRKQLAQTRLGPPSVLFGDWRKYYDAVRVMRASELGGRKIYVIQLESAGLPPTLLSLDAETGDVLQTQRTMSSVDGAIPVTTTYSDYREVGGMRVPHRYVESTEIAGRTIYHVERVEVGVTLAPETFTLELSTASGRGR